MEEQTLIQHNEWAEFDGVAYTAWKLLPRVTISPECVISLGMKALAALDNPKAVKLFHDGRRSRIGIRSSHTEDPRAFPVGYKSKGKNGVVHARRFCKRFNIQFAGTVEFLNVKTEDEMLILDFKSARQLR